MVFSRLETILFPCKYHSNVWLPLNFFEVSYAHQECIFDQKYGKNDNVLEYYYHLNELLVFNISYYYEKQLCCLMSF